MIKYYDDCAACDTLDHKPSCDGCRNRHIPMLFCDICGEEVEDLKYDTDGKHICPECILKRFQSVKVEEE